MKLPFKLFLMALLCLIITSSCKKETPEPEKDIFKVQIDGTLIDLTYNTAFIGDFMTSPSGKMVRIVGSSSNLMINLNILDYNGVGEYYLRDNQRQVLGGYVKKAQGGEKEENYILIEGKVQIFSITDGKIKGTFYFTATDYSGGIKKAIDGIFYLGLTK